MNCQTYRQHYTLDPSNQDHNFLSHKQACSACTAFTEKLMLFEQTLVEAINVKIPDGLTERILQRQSNIQDTPSLLVKLTSMVKRIWHRQTRRTEVTSHRQQPIYALAASLLLVIGLFASSQWWWQIGMHPLSREIIAYVENAPPTYQTNAEVPKAELRGMFQAIGAKLTGDIGKVNFCRLLTLQGYNSAHMVLAGTKGPINVLFIRDSKLTELQNLRNGELNGIILPAAWGNMAIIGVPEEPLDKIAERINEGVVWL